MTHSFSNNDWVVATVEQIETESPMVKSFYFQLPHAVNHVAGQHYELRLTAQNGYQAARLYSAADPGDGTERLHLAIMNVDSGEVSSYITQDLHVGDTIEVRGPFGKFFVWNPEIIRPVLLIAGGSGVVPMHAILQAHRQSGAIGPIRLLYSARRQDDILFKADFLNKSDVTITLTQEEWSGQTGRIDTDMLRAVLDTVDAPLCYICGMSAFVDAVSEGLVALGIPATDIKTERFG